MNPVGGAITGPSEPTPQAAAENRALVKISRGQCYEPTHLPGAPFLAQLIAFEQKLPQTRERRRAEPRDAAAAYAHALAAIPLDPMLSRLA